MGEAWLSYFDSDALRAKLADMGFSEIEDLGPPQIIVRFTEYRSENLTAKGALIIRTARV